MTSLADRNDTAPETFAPEEETQTVDITVNGRSRRDVVPTRELLVDYLRGDRGLTGTHIGCDEGVCGACTVHVDGKPMKSCMMLCAQADGCEVRTVESLGTPDALSPLQANFKKFHGLQCGYCTPGMLMSAQALLGRNPDPSEDDVRKAIAGNLCRCTGYQNIVDAILATAAQARGETYTAPLGASAHPEEGEDWIGRSVERAQDNRLLTGHGRYTADQLPAGTLHAAVLRSPHAHARIVRIDASRALALDGVEYVLTGQDAKETWNPFPPTINLGYVLNTSYALAVDKAVYQGEPIAAVAARDPYVAEDALALIDVEYEVLTPITSIAQALEGTVKVYDDWDDNVGMDVSFTEGDVEGAFERAAHVVRHSFHHHRYTAAPMEARVTLASFDVATGDLRIDMSTQSAHQCRTLFAQMLGMPEGRIQVVAKDVGGGFGIKLQIYDDVLPVMLALKTGRPVLWVETRAENFLSGIHARDYDADLEAAFDADGRILALKADWLGDAGCDGTNRAHGIGQHHVALFYGSGNYKVPAYQARARGVVTNKAPYGPYRGYGKDVANQSIERLMQVAARQIGMDPNELRRRNFIQPDEFPYEILTGPIYDSGNYPELVRMAEEAMGQATFRRRQQAALAEGKYIGLGYAMMLEPAGGSVPNSVFNANETATLRMMPEGDFVLLTGMQDIGQGITTAYAQIVAQEMHVDPEQVKVICGDTDKVPYGLGAWSSRGAAFGMSSTAEASRALHQKLRKIAAQMLELDDPFQLEPRQGGFDGPGGKSIDYRVIGNGVHLWPGPIATVPKGVMANLEETYTWQSKMVRWVPRENGSLSIYTNHSSGCYAVEVEVDIETGQIRLSRIYVAHDCGKVVNPMIVNGQVHGGVVQGIGGILEEELRYDDRGNLLNTGLFTYTIPEAVDLPRIEVGHLESPSPFTTLGTKGMGEGGPVGVPAAVMNAVEDALAPLGVELTETPLSPDRMLKMIASARQEG
jgi:carbon-monoxide dehydrogenase large subunit